MKDNELFLKALVYGIAGSFFFAFTFVLNRSMNLSGGYWGYSASLRYIWTLPILWVLLLKDRKYQKVLINIKANPLQWFLWSTVGFGLFYAPLSAASVYAQSWFTCAIWQFTIVAGVLLTPLFGKKIPVKNLLCSCLVLAGIIVMQIPVMGSDESKNLPLALALIAVAAFSYPLGNRKMMSFIDEGFSTLERVFGMTLCSMPFWMALFLYSYLNVGAPAGGQCLQTLGVALFSGVIATILFFQATDMVKKNAKELAVIEATQCGEVIFTLLLGIVFLHDALPEPVGFLGIAMIVAGMILNSIL